MTSFSHPALGGVYKLTALDEGGEQMVPKIKRSDNPEKITNPGQKKVARMVDPEGRVRGDVLFLDEEKMPEKIPFKVHHPMLPHVHKTYPSDFKIQELMVPIFLNGKPVYNGPSLHKIRENTLQNLHMLDAAYKRFHNPHTYHVSLSPLLRKTKGQLLRKAIKK